jgi:ABC-type amino acid transport substrate-binding protein
LEEIDRLWVYLAGYTGTGVVLAFWVLPMLVTALTPFSYRQVVGVSRDAVMTAFATGKLFVVLPLLIDASHQLFKELELDETTAGDTASVLVPLAYPFPSIGKLLALLFIPFAAWYVGSPMAAHDYPMLIVAGVLSLFGSPLAAVPYLLDLFRLPADMFNLFMVSGVWATRVGDVVGAMHLLTFSVLATCAMGGFLRFSPRRLLAVAGSTVVITVVAVVGLESRLEGIVRSSTDGVSTVERIDLRRDPAPHTILAEATPNPVLMEEGQTRLERIRETGRMRVGFNADQLPFAYYNADGDLVGFDIEMAHRFAQELGVAIEFVPFNFETLPEQLTEDHFDIAMSGMVGTFENLQSMVLAYSGVDVLGALVVEDHMRDEVASIEVIRAFDDLNLGIIGGSRISARFHDRVPGANVVQLDNHQQYFEGDRTDVTALVTTAEAGAAWTLRYPEFQVVVPAGIEVKGRIVYPIGGKDLLFMDFVEQWAALAGDNGTVDELYKHWILGQGAVEHKPRWSVMRDVLHWVE